MTELAIEKLYKYQYQNVLQKPDTFAIFCRKTQQLFFINKHSCSFGDLCGPSQGFPSGSGLWHSGPVAKWSNGQVAQWPSGQVAQWPSGPVAQWPSGPVARTSHSQLREPRFESCAIKPVI